MLLKILSNNGLFDVHVGYETKLSNLRLKFEWKTALCDNFNKTDASDIQADYETYAILRYNSKQKLLLLILSVKEMFLITCCFWKS